LDASLLPFFRPRGVVVVGVSRDPTKLGYGVARNLVHSGYTGAIHFVNPRGGHLFDRPLHPRIAAVPDPVDLAVLVIPAASVPEALRGCAARGIRAVTIASGGFREVGPEGAALEAECARIAAEHGLRLLGPNCIGLLDTHLPCDTTFLPPPGPLAGEVAFLSHSGAICAAVTDWATGQGFGLSRLVSLGNQADLTEADLLAPTAEDPYTRVITLYLEGINHGRRFIEQAAQVSRRTPILALKVGRSAGGRRAVASHTGALAGQEVAYEAAFRRAGVIRAETSEEMFDWARALAWCPLPVGQAVAGSNAKRYAMAVLTNAGGPGAVAADALEAHHLPLAELSAHTQAALRDLLPPAASLRNPVDMLASASPAQYAGSLKALLDDPAVSGALVILPPPPMYTAEAVVDAMLPVIQAAVKPVVIALMGEALIQRAAARLRAAHVPDYRFPERAASALATLVQRAEALARPAEAPVLHCDVRPEVVAGLLGHGAEGWLDPVDAARALAAYGLPTPQLELARAPDEAALAAARLGFPVALKIASPDLPHKSDVGGVLLDLRDEAAVAAGFNALVERVRSARPQAQVQGAHVQRLAPPGQDVIIGAVQDAQFGPLVMFGSGGVEAEARRDVAFALAPLTRAEAEAMLEATWAGRRLRGFRGQPPADRAAALDALLRLAQLAADCPQLAEIEINPLRVLAQGQGAVAIDVRARRR